MTKGIIVLTPFPFTDLTAVKKRPAVIVSKTNNENDAIVAFISSRVYEPSETDFILEMTHPDFEKTGLKVRSVIKLAKWLPLIRISCWVNLENAARKLFWNWIKD